MLPPLGEWPELEVGKMAEDREGLQREARQIGGSKRPVCDDEDHVWPALVMAGCLIVLLVMR